MSQCSPVSSGGARPGAYRRRVAIIAAGAALLLPAAGVPATAHAGGAQILDAQILETQILETTVLAAPRPVPGSDERTHLVYEVMLRNVSARPVQLDRVEVLEPGRTEPVAVYDSRAIEQVLLDPGAHTFSRVLAPRQVRFAAARRHGGGRCPGAGPADPPLRCVRNRRPDHAGRRDKGRPA